MKNTKISSMDDQKDRNLGVKIIVGEFFGMIVVFVLGLLLKDTPLLPIVVAIALMLWVVLVVFIIKYFIGSVRSWFK